MLVSRRERGGLAQSALRAQRNAVRFLGGLCVSREILSDLGASVDWQAFETTCSHDPNSEPMPR